jgi:hypothetical protein
MPMPSSEDPIAEQPPGHPASPISITGYPEQDENGVDLSLIRSMLELSPLERFRLMERKARETLTLNQYGRRHREDQSARSC